MRQLTLLWRNERCIFAAPIVRLGKLDTSILAQIVFALFLCGNYIACGAIG
jgi:hypothetical protein